MEKSTAPLTNEKLTEVLKDFNSKVQQQSKLFLGYPSNLKHNYKQLFRFFKFDSDLSNVVDPFVESHYQLKY